MDRNKKYRHIKKSTAAIAATFLLLGTSGGVYAATDGAISKLWDKVNFTIDGKEVDLKDYMKTNEDGSSYLAYEDENGSYTISANPTAIPKNWDCNLNIDTSDNSSAMTIVEYPFTLVPEGEKLYLLVTETSEKIDITKEAASKEGYSYTWATAQGTNITAIVFGTPEKHSIHLD